MFGSAGHLFEGIFHGFVLAAVSIKRRRLSAILVIVTLAFGIGAFCATGSALLVLGADPLEGRGRSIFHPQLDPRPLHARESSVEPPDDMNLADARNVYRMAEGLPRVITSQNWLPLMGQGANGAIARMSITRATTRDFFAMFGAHMKYGAAWSPLQDTDRERVIVLSAAANQSIFGGENSVGRQLAIATKAMTVVGVLRPWRVAPKIYDLNDGPFSEPEEIFMPFETWLDLPQDYGYGPMRCFGASDEESHDPSDDHCTWVQSWVTLPEGRAATFAQQLAAYSRDQKQSGSYGRLPNVRLRSVTEWLEYKDVVPASSKAQFWVALGLLLACLITVSGLQGVSFRARFPELGVRRAMGASRAAIVWQLVVEGSVLGFFGGVLGIVISVLGIFLLRMSPENYASYIELDAKMVFASVALGVFTMLATSFLPAVRASAVPPYRQMQMTG